MDRFPNNGRVILLSEEDTTLARVISREEGLTVKDQKIRIDDLLNAMLEMIEPSELSKVIMKNGDVVSEVVEPTLNNLRGEALSRSLGKIVERAKTTEDMNLVADLFKIVASKFDLDLLDEGSLVGFLQYLLMRSQGITNEDVFADLFLYLLSKVKLADNRSEELLREVFGILSRIQDAKAKEFIRTIAADFLPKVKTVSTPILPKGTILYQEESDGTKIIVLERDRARRDVLFHNTPYSQVGHPKLLFAFKVKQSRIVNCQIVAVKDVTIKPKTKLYRYPFSNVHSDHSACWSDIGSIEVQNLIELQNLPDLFFNSPANNHLFEGENLREWFFKLQNKDFEESDLTPINLSVQDFFEMFSAAADTSGTEHEDEDEHEDDAEEVIAQIGGFRITA